MQAANVCYQMLALEFLWLQKMLLTLLLKPIHQPMIAIKVQNIGAGEII